MRKNSLIVLAGMLMIVLAFSNASAATLAGSLQVGDGVECGGSATCLAWANAGCPPQLAMKDGFDASIVDASAAANKPSTFKSVRGTPIDFGGDFVYVQFYNAQCKHIANSKKSFGLGATTAFTVPVGTKWMTVTGNLITSSRLTWTLTF